MTIRSVDQLRSAQLQRILESRTFRNTEVLKKLLSYLGQKALAGENEGLKEYIIGVEAFGKAPDYDPKADSGVRVQAGKLRQKLEEYYRTEGMRDPLLVDLPKGQFGLAFQEHDVAVFTPVPAPREKSRTLPWLLAIAAVVIAATATILGLDWQRERARTGQYGSPDMRALWQPFFDDRRPVIVSLGSPLFVKVGRTFLRYPGLDDWDTAKDADRVKELEQRAHAPASAAFNYTGVGEATAAFELARLFSSLHHDLNLVLSRALTWEDIERHNVIFIGPPKYNLQEKDLPVRQDFVIENGRIVNVHPRLGEPQFFEETRAADGFTSIEGHALIARLPGLHGAGFMMILASTSTEGARAAVEFATRPDYAARLVRSLRDSHGAIPRYFQVVVRARFKSQTPLYVEPVLVHVLGK